MKVNKGTCREEFSAGGGRPMQERVRQERKAGRVNRPTGGEKFRETATVKTMDGLLAIVRSLVLILTQSDFCF